MITWDPDTKKAFWENGVYIGDIEKDVDGFYKYWPSKNGGYYDEWFLYSIYFKLKEMNKAWQETIDNDPVLRFRGNDVEQGEPI